MVLSERKVPGVHAQLCCPAGGSQMWNLSLGLIVEEDWAVPSVVIAQPERPLPYRRMTELKLVALCATLSLEEVDVLS